MNLQRAPTGSWYVRLTRHDKIIIHVFHQVAFSMVKKSESQDREMARLRDHQQLIDMIAELREEVRQRGRLITSEAPQSGEKIPQVSLV